jgi:hypothetical protein
VIGVSINSRSDFRDLLYSRMKDSYESVRDEQKLDVDQNFLKSNLIETNRENLDEAVLAGEQFAMKVENTENQGFKILKVKKDDKRYEFYLDKMDERFWSIHSLEGSEITKQVINKMVFPRYTKLDFTWFSNRFMEDIWREDSNSFRRFNLQFEDEVAEEEEDADIGKLSMQLWGRKANSVLEALRESEEVSGSTSLSVVGVKQKYEDEVLLEDINYKGKFTARGDAVESHFREMRTLRDNYKSTLDRLEQENAIQYKSKSHGTTVKGRPLVINFAREIEDMENFIKTIFSSSKPFRLWGVKNEISDGYFRFSAVDMHTGDKLDIEVCEDFLRIYLPEGACGNVVLRMYTNIQHYFDSRANLRGDDSGEDITAH